MSSSRRVFMAGLGGVLALGLAACSGLTPVYETPSMSGAAPALAFATPSSRTEQIIYQDLALRFARGGDGAPKLTVAASASTRGLTSGLVTRAQTQQQAVVSAQITLVDADGKTLFTGKRSATADFTTDGQVLSNEAATQDATSRAAHLLADSIRLIVLGALAR